jgi:protein SCO1/2
MRRGSKRLVLLVSFAVLIWGISRQPRALSDDSKTDEKRALVIPNSLLMTQDKKEVRFYDDLVKHKIVIIHLMYTTCSLCDRGTKNLELVQTALGNDLGRDVFMYSISIEPKDTPEILKKYANTHEAKPGWTFLTGRPEDITALRRKLGLANVDPDTRAKLGLPQLDPNKAADPKLHTGKILILNDDYGRRAKVSVLERPDKILHLIEEMKPPRQSQK